MTKRYDKPMSLSESEELLRSADNWDATKRGWATDLGILALVLVAVAFAGLALFGLATTVGPVIAVIAFVAAVIIWHDKK